MKRAFDLFISLTALIIFIVPMILIALLIKINSAGPAFYWSDRVGRNNKIFKMPKFRSMKFDTPSVATHLLEEHERYLTKIGVWLRKLSLDELPQLFSILKGDMSIVGPRPALFNQSDLIEMRTSYGVHELTPGLTGWAQINGRDEIPIPAKVQLDCEYLEKQSFMFDMKIILLTFLRVIEKKDVSH